DVAVVAKAATSAQAKAAAAVAAAVVAKVSAAEGAASSEAAARESAAGATGGRVLLNGTAAAPTEAPADGPMHIDGLAEAPATSSGDRDSPSAGASTDAEAAPGGVQRPPPPKVAPCAEVRTRADVVAAEVDPPNTTAAVIAAAAGAAAEAEEGGGEAAAAAGRAVAAERLRRDAEAMGRASAAAVLSVAALQARGLGEQEERHVAGLLADLQEARLRRLEGKMRSLNELEAFLVRERRLLEADRTELFCQNARMWVNETT
ncbi:unnamed protein product, partial [Phaeothamnion confervicola]